MKPGTSLTPCSGSVPSPSAQGRRRACPEPCRGVHPRWQSSASRLRARASVGVALKVGCRSAPFNFPPKNTPALFSPEFLSPVFAKIGPMPRQSKIQKTIAITSSNRCPPVFRRPSYCRNNFAIRRNNHVRTLSPKCARVEIAGGVPSHPPKRLTSVRAAFGIPNSATGRGECAPWPMTDNNNEKERTKHESNPNR